MEKYNHNKIEKRWQKVWDKLEIFKTKDFSKKPKAYILVEFPYPSGGGLHVGHCRSYTALDVLARKKRMDGFNVLFPMGWDAFGLPTENYAIKAGIHPKEATKRNTMNFKRQQRRLGISFDWSREINTTDPLYYKWTQWIFLQLFKNGLAYKSKIPINWCSSCKIGLANEEVIDGKCERCGQEVTKKEKEQWLLKITKYAERLIKDLDNVDYPQKVIISQKDWIGKSKGWEIKFPISNISISVFTTRIDTLFGCTYLVLAPEHPIIKELKSKITNLRSVERYIEKSKKRSERERISDFKEKIGVELQGIKATNPANGRKISVWIADYVLVNYGTGAIMAVPGHDQRDFDFAKQYNLPILEVIKPLNSKSQVNQAYEGEGILINSGRFNGISSEKAKNRIGEFLEKKFLTKRAIFYKLRDWIFSRQKYWGEPIPLVFCKNCKEKTINFKNKGEILNPGWFGVDEKDLPIKLPYVSNYRSTKTGESPLATNKKWVNLECPRCKGPAKRETDVMPNWAGSNWYFLRYCDPQNNNKLADIKLLNYWMPVDWYNGGMEHTTLHLLYSRFIYKFLWDIGAVPKSIGSEPFKKRTSHGMVLSKEGIKMSKSKGNVINPEEIIDEYGADTMRLYEMFMGPFDQSIMWNTKGVKGARRFLDKIYNLSERFFNSPKSKSSINLEKLLNKTIKKVLQDIDNLKFNTAISSLMEFSNAWQQDTQGLGKQDFKKFLKILSIFTPYLGEELWQKLKNKSVSLKDFNKKDSIHSKSLPKYDEKLIQEKIITLIIQINGKVRDQIDVDINITKKQAEKLILKQEKVKKWIKNNKIKKIIFIQGKLINIVI